MKKIKFQTCSISEMMKMDTLPTLYEYYTGNGITSGLSANQTYFTLNNKNITIYGGSMHYFRVPQEYWRDRLRKMRAAGLNAVESYIPWNLHEPEPGTYDFGDGGTDFQELLHVQKFLKICQEEDLLAIVRPGPFICAQFEFGGLPSWLLREKDIRVRTSDIKFVNAFQRYFKVLFSILTALQFTRGGPIVAFQIENEYGNIINPDATYMQILKDTFIENGVVELLFTSDVPILGDRGKIPGILYTANFQNLPKLELSLLQLYQNNRPSMVMEYWSGWYDFWMEKHHTTSLNSFTKVLTSIIKYPASVNMYMFHGGTTWGFTNGGNIKGFRTDNSQLRPDTNSYDYDAPLNEAGDYTDKYDAVRRILKLYNTVPTRLPELPLTRERVAYSNITIIEHLDFPNIVAQAEHHIFTKNLLSMESLPINNNAGQSFGYIVYRKNNITIEPYSKLKIEGHICDSAIVLINGELISKVLTTISDINGFGYWKTKNGILNLGKNRYENAILDIIVLNWGRANLGQLNQYNQFKGLWQGNVTINRNVINDWEIVPLEFKKKWNRNLINWSIPKFKKGPALYKAILNISEAQDTFIDMRGWNSGIIIVNGFVLSRYLHLGPQQTAYLPAPFLKKGINEILVFEHFVPNSAIKFSTNAIYETQKKFCGSFPNSSNTYQNDKYY